MTELILIDKRYKNICRPVRSACSSCRVQGAVSPSSHNLGISTEFLDFTRFLWHFLFVLDRHFMRIHKIIAKSKDIVNDRGSEGNWGKGN